MDRKGNVDNQKSMSHSRWSCKDIVRGTKRVTFDLACGSIVHTILSVTNELTLHYNEVHGWPYLKASYARTRHKRTRRPGTELEYANDM